MIGPSIYDFAFGCVVIIAPLALVLLVRPWLLRVIDDEPTLGQVNRLTLAAGAWTCSGLIAYLIRLLWFAPNPSAIAIAPWVLLFGFFVFFLMVMPSLLLARKYPKARLTENEATSAEVVPTRSASLTPRESDLPIKHSAWIVLWCVWAVGVAALVWSLTHPHEDVDATTRAARCLLPFFSAVVLVVGPRSLRVLADEAEPLDAAESPQLAEGYRSLRHFRAHTRFYLMHVGFVVTTTALLCVLPWDAPEHTFLAASIVVYLALGVASLVCAIVANVRRARLTELLDRLSAEHAKPPV